MLGAGHDAVLDQGIQVDGAAVLQVVQRRNVEHGEELGIHQGEVLQLRHPAVQRHLATLEAGARGATRTGFLAAHTEAAAGTLTRSIVQGGLAAQALGQDILDAGEFEHCADGTASDHTGTRGCRADEHAGSTITTIGEGRDGVVAGQRHFDEVLLAIGNTLADGTDHITGLADTNADLAFLVADNHDGPEAHLLTAFHGLGDAADLNHALLPFGIAFLAATAAALFLLLLPFGCRWNVGRTRHGVGIGLGGGICHGLSRNQN